MRLAEFQSRFQAAVLDPKNKLTDAELGIVSRAEDHPQLKMAIHWHHFWSRMEKYARRHRLLEQYLGPADYKLLVRDYIAVYPPTNIIASTVSERLSEFLATQEPWCSSPILTHLADYDWHRATVTAASDERTLHPDDLGDMPQEALLSLRVRRKKRALTCNAYYKFHELDLSKVPRDTPPDTTPTYLLVERVGSKVRVRELDVRMYVALGLLDRAIALGDFLRKLADLGFSQAECARCSSALFSNGLLVPGE